MKTLLAITVAVIMGNVFADTSPVSSSTGSRHMFEFSTDSELLSVLSLSKSKTRGQDSSNNTNFNLTLNYAYSLPSMPKLQLAGRMHYIKQDAVAGRGDAEDYGAQIGAILNHSEDLQNSCYASLYLGYGWANTYGAGASSQRRDELLTSTLAVGHRFALERFGIKHLTYSPEVALRNQNSTTGGSIEYLQDIQFRILQFSVFF